MMFRKSFGNRREQQWELNLNSLIDNFSIVMEINAALGTEVMDILMQQKRQNQAMEVECLSLKSTTDNILKGYQSAALNHRISLGSTLGNTKKKRLCKLL